MADEKIRIIAVEYLNTAVFVSGLSDADALASYELELANPAICAETLKNRRADIGLVPVAALPELKPNFIFSSFCIGAIGPVRTVTLFANQAVHELTSILVDGHSRTSVQLLKILLKEYWKIYPQVLEVNLSEWEGELLPQQGLMAIGDKVFGLEGQFNYSYDLAEHWLKFSGKPFVFAAWVAMRELTDQQVDQFEQALRNGFNSFENIVNVWGSKQKFKTIDVAEYLTKNISFDFDDAKKQGLLAYWQLLDRSDYQPLYK